jgi:dihydroorotase
MKAVICGAKKYSGGKFSGEPLFIDGGRVVSSAPANAQVFHFDNMYIFPGFADVHVHLREPGFSYKETIASGERRIYGSGRHAESLPRARFRGASCRGA